MLNALSLGARELASLPVPKPTFDSSRVQFPSKLLPPSMHQRYIAHQSNPTNVTQRLLADITQNAIDRTTDEAAETVPEMQRERRLRIRQPQKISDAQSSKKLPMTTQQQEEALTAQRTSFSQVAAEFFVMPLINRFWLFLRDEQAREERTRHLEGQAKYKGAGTGLILNPLVLSHMLNTLAVLVHASRNAPEWTGIMGPDTLELALTLGTRPMTLLDNKDEGTPETTMGVGGDDRQSRNVASVLTACLELALIVLDGSLELDRGRSLSLDHTSTLLGVSEWANAVFESLEKGITVREHGGVHEMDLKRMAAGVVLKANEISGKWRQSMIQGW